MSSNFTHKTKFCQDRQYKLSNQLYNNIRIRDAPGQRSIYIIPGDPHQESYRLSTYLKHPPTSPANPSLLAKSGFYFTGYKDRVKCFCCGLSVENWTSSDDVMAPRWHTSDCLMMKKEECGNVPIGMLWLLKICKLHNYSKNPVYMISPFIFIGI